MLTFALERKVRVSSGIYDWRVSLSEVGYEIFCHCRQQYLVYDNASPFETLLYMFILFGGMSNTTESRSFEPLGSDSKHSFNG